jgi:hypothetical protein
MAFGRCVGRDGTDFEGAGREPRVGLMRKRGMEAGACGTRCMHQGDRGVEVRKKNRFRLEGVVEGS